MTTSESKSIIIVSYIHNAFVFIFCSAIWINPHNCCISRTSNVKFVPKSNHILIFNYVSKRISKYLFSLPAGFLPL